MSTTRVLIQGEQILFREALQKLLEKEQSILFVGSVSGVRETLDLMEKSKPDIILLIMENSHSAPGMEILRRLASTQSKVRTILVTSSIERDQIIEALRLGAYGVVRKETTSQMLFKSIDAVMSGVYWVDQESVSGLVEALCHTDQNTVSPTVYGLTPRELEILSAIVEGYTNQDIAEKFHISTQTVKHHLSSIFKKVGTSNRLELALFAVNQRLLPES